MCYAIRQKELIALKRNKFGSAKSDRRGENTTERNGIEED